MPNPWRLYAQQTHKLEQKFVPYIIGVIKTFRENFIADLQYHGKDYALSELHSRIIHDQLTPLLTTIYKTAGLMGARMTAAELKAAAKQKANGFGRNEQWVKDVMKYLQDHMLGFVQDITDTMRSDIIRIMQKSVDNGWSINTTVDEVQKQGLIQARAEVIARTEINRAANTGHSIAAKSTPYEVDKKWIGAGDHRERHSHVLMNNRTVAELGYYDVPVFQGGAEIATDHMQYPGDPNAHGSNTINCRCRVIYVPKRDANGRLIMRQQGVAPVIPMPRPTSYTPAQIAAELKAHVVITTE